MCVEGERKKEMGVGQDPFKRELSDHAQEVLLVATTEDIYPRIRSVQVSEY